MSAERAERCQDCGAPLERAQRYCIACGARTAARSPQLQELLDRTRKQRRSDVADASTPVAAAPAPGLGARARHLFGAFAPLSALRLPSLPISAVLVLAFLGFGVVLGVAARSASSPSLAASSRPLRVVLAPSAGGRTPTTAEPSASSPQEPSSGGGEAPAGEPEASPAPAVAEGPPTTPAHASTPSKHSPSGGSGKQPKTSTGNPPAPAGAPATKLPALRHVFVIMLSDEPYALTFGPESPAPYLAKTLERRGALLVHYDAVAHQELANGVALISGQGPTPETAVNCPDYADVAPAGAGAEEQVLGNGCVYPSTTQTLADQLTAKHLSWRAYIEGIGAGTAAAACAHPPLGSTDSSAAPPAAGESYATFRNPFVYFHSLIDSPACATGDVGLAQLSGDLASAERTPNFSYIAPNLCHDGSPVACAPGAPAGLAAADTFLKTIVPQILSSKAYKQNGLLVITTDNAPAGGEFGDSSSCCGQPQFPNLPGTRSRALAPRRGQRRCAAALAVRERRKHKPRTV